MFKAYDIRGTVNKDFSMHDFKLLGVGLGKWLRRKGLNKICVGYDTRQSSPELTRQLIIGLTSNDLTITLQPHITTPLNVWSMMYLGFDAAAMVTASHNPWEDNGLKLYLNKGFVYPVCGEELSQIQLEDTSNDSCCFEEIDLIDKYISSMPKAPKGVLWNANYGGASRIVAKLGDTVNLWSENCYDALPHGPDPAAAPLIDKNSDLILSLDGDGDRLQVCYKQQLLTAEEIATALPAVNIVHDVHLSQVAKSTLKANLIESKVGHSFVQQAMREHDADMGFEASGHFFFKELGTMDDAIYAGIKFVQNITALKRIKGYVSKIIRIPNNHPGLALTKIEEFGLETGALISKTDGIKLIYNHGWILVRASNTQNCLSVMFEGVTQLAYLQLQTQLGDLLTRF